MSQESKTPRTDAEASDAANYAPIEKGWYVHVDFAGQLERELAAVTEARRAMSFRADYVLPANGRTAMHMLGNAVPPLAARRVIEALRKAA